MLLSDETYTVEDCNYDELPEQIKTYCLPDNGSGKEYASYLIVKHNGVIVRYESDAMEPEDVRFYRDLAWVADALLEAYKLGRVDGRAKVAQEIKDGLEKERALVANNIYIKNYRWQDFWKQYGVQG